MQPDIDPKSMSTIADIARRKNVLGNFRHNISGSLSVSETAKDLLTEAHARLASREATSSGGFLFLLGTPYLFLFLSLNAFIFFSIHLVIVTLYLQRQRGVFNNNDKQGIGRPTGGEFGSKKEPITRQTKQGSTNTKDSTGRATANKFVNTTDDIANLTSNNFVNATDEITIHVGDVSWVRVCLKVWEPMPVRCMSLIRQVVDGSYVSTGSGLLRLPT